MGFFSNILDKLGIGSANAAPVPATELAPDLAARAPAAAAAPVVNPIAMVDVLAQMEQRAAAVAPPPPQIPSPEGAKYL